MQQIRRRSKEVNINNITYNFVLTFASDSTPITHIFNEFIMEKNNLSDINSQHDLYLQEIEGIDDYWGPTFRLITEINFLNLNLSEFVRSRAIFDNDEHLEFKKKLEDRIKHHDKDIERLCNVYYQGFIESVRELLEVRSQSNKLNVRNLIM